MKCRIVIGLMSDFIDGNINKNLAKEIKIHISNCSRCSENYEFTKKIVNTLHCLKYSQLSVNCWPDIKDKLNIVQERRFWYKSRPFQMVGAFGVAFVLLIILTIGVFNVGNQSVKTKNHLQTNALNEKNFILQHVSSFNASPLDDADADLISADMINTSYANGIN